MKFSFEPDRGSKVAFLYDKCFIFTSEERSSLEAYKLEGTRSEEIGNRKQTARKRRDGETERNEEIGTRSEETEINKRINFGAGEFIGEIVSKKNPAP